MHATAPTASGDARRTADRILDEAEALFAERGFAATAVRDIAARAGVNPASLYNHFEGKQGLYEAVLERGLRPVYEILERVARNPDADVLRELIEYFSEARNVARLVQHEALSGADSLSEVAGRWLRPLYTRALAGLEYSPARGDWSSEELPLLLLTYHHLIFGHFATAGALGEALGEDLSSPDAVERQVRFIEKVTERLLGIPEERRVREE